MNTKTHISRLLCAFIFSASLTVIGPSIAFADNMGSELGVGGNETANPPALTLDSSAGDSNDGSNSPNDTVEGVLCEGVEWAYSESDSKLTLSGEGEIIDQTIDWAQPWEPYVSSIQIVVVEEGISKIGAYTFTGMDALKTIELPASIQAIGEYAIEGCSALNDIHYSGSALSWDEVEIADGNERLQSEIAIYHEGSWNDANLAAAKSFFDKLNDESKVFISSGSADFESVLLSAKNRAASSSKAVIVFAEGREYEGKFRTIIPDNVVLVSSTNTVYRYAGEDKQTFILLNGSIYGGTFDGCSPYEENSSTGASAVIQFANTEFTNENGIVAKATVVHAQKNGILAYGPATKNTQVIESIANSNVANGISIEKGAHMALIKSCVTQDNGIGDGSGINISHSDVDEITDCQIVDNLDKGISTNSDWRLQPSYMEEVGESHIGCNIGKIVNNLIRGNRINGVYIKPYCYVDEFKGNQLLNNSDGLTVAAMSSSNKDNTGPCQVKIIENNIFDGNCAETDGNLLVNVKHKGAKAYIGSGNVVKNSKGTGIIVQSEAELVIGGDGNKVTNNAGTGLLVKDGAQVTITGQKNEFKYNKEQGVYVNGGSLTISGYATKLEDNLKQGLSGLNSAKIVISGNSTQINRSTSDAGVYLSSKSTLKISGKKTKVVGNKTYGMYLNDGAGLTISGESTQIMNNGDSGLYLKKGSNANLGSGAAKTIISGNKGHGVHLNAAAIKVNGKNSEILSNKKNGIYADASSTVAIGGESTKINKNSDCGIKGLGKSKIDVNANNVEFCENGNRGIYLSNASLALKKSNVNINKNKQGIYAEKNASITISGNSANINRNTDCGIRILSGTKMKVSGKVFTVYKNSGRGIYLKDKGTELVVSGADAKITNNGNVGLYLDSGSKANFGTGAKKARINSNSGHGVYLNSSTLTMSGSDSQIRLNKRYGVLVNGSGAKSTIKKNIKVSSNTGKNIVAQNGGKSVRS